MRIRTATPADAERIREIYAPYVEDTAISFELTPPSVEEMRSRIVATLENYPYLVAEDDLGVVQGYAYVSKFRPREAYIHSVETSIYIDSKCRQSGYGSALYEKLETILLKQNIYVLYANITFTEDKNDSHVNDDSIKFHQKLGYELVGRHSQCGYKFGRWYGVCWMEKNISIRPAIVEPFIPFSKLSVDL